MLNKISKKRLLDGQIGILGWVIWFHVLTNYGACVQIIDISTRWLFDIKLEYYPDEHFRKYYPSGWTFKFKLFGRIFIDTGKEGREMVSNSVKEWTEIRDREAKILKEKYPKAAHRIH